MPTTEIPMDLAQATQRIAWLDEERRRDHAELARLSQEVTNLLAILKDQAVRIRETGDRVGSVESTLVRLPRLEDAITLARSEILPLRDTDIRLQDDIQRHAKDRQVQADQTARLWGEVNARLEVVTRHIDGIVNRVGVLETQRRDLSERVGDVAGRLDILSKSVDGLTSRLQLVETREKDTVSRLALLQSHLTRIENTQTQALEEVKRSVARVEGLVTDIQQVRRDVVLAQEEEGKRRKEAVAALSEQREAVATVQRHIEESVKDIPLLGVRLARLEETTLQIAETAHRLTSVEEQVTVVESMYKSLQEVEDRHWGTDIPQILHSVEESGAATQAIAATVRELEASDQQLKEDVRKFQVDLAVEHAFSEDLAAALRGFLEEFLQTRLAITQKQLQTLRHMANTPVTNTPEQIQQ